MQPPSTTRLLGAAVLAQSDTVQRATWKVTSLLTGIAVAVTARSLLTRAWTTATGDEPPTNPADPTTDLADALLWSAAVGAGVGVARMANRRALAAAFEAVADERPPHLRADDA